MGLIRTGPKAYPGSVGAFRPSSKKIDGAKWNSMSGAGRSSRVRKKPPASGMFELSGPRPSFSSSSKFSGVKIPNSAGASVV